MREESISLRIKPVIEQRFDGGPKEVVDQDQARQDLISHLIRQVLHSSKKQEFMQELLTEEGRTFTPISDQARKVIKEQSNVEAFELLELTDKVQCTHCHRYLTSGHVCCYCGRILVYTIQDPVIEDQTQRHAKQQFELLTTISLLLKQEP